MGFPSPTYIRYLWVEFILSCTLCMRTGYGILTRVVSGYLQDPSENHWNIILKYLRNTKDRWLGYGESNLKLMKYDFNF